MSAGERDPTHATTKLSSASVERLQSRPPAAGVSLLVYHRDGGRLVPMAPNTSVVVGRLAPADVTVPDVSLSREHARFTLTGDELTVEDLGSTNGTLLGGRPIEREVLRPGDEVTLGAVTVTVHFGGDGRADLVGHDRFRDALDAEVERARFFGRAASVLLIRALRGKEAPVRFWSPRVQAHLRGVDRVGLYSDDAMFALLPEASADQAVELARRVIQGSADLAALVCGVASFPTTATSAEELLGECRGAAQRATAEEPVVAPGQGSHTWLSAARGEASGLIAESPRMRELVHTASRISKVLIPVLLHGETGTGKEVLARHIHESGPRHAGPLVCVNCAAIPAQLLESTLFGHEKGSFTGAHSQQKGVFEAASGGTVFLDEIAELPTAAQAALLRVLETKRFARVGSTKEISVDVRVIAATHRDLEEMVARGEFREDLYYRLNTITLKVPPLRDRVEDIAPLASRFLRAANEANDTSVGSIEPEALEALQTYSWRGNVRELKNAIERAVAITQGASISIDDLPDRARSSAKSAPVAPVAPASVPASSLAPVRQLEGDFRSRMERLEAEVLIGALIETGWNHTEAARQLSMPVRTFFHKVKMHGIKKAGSKNEPG